MLVILSGVAGAGKDTIKQQLINNYDNITTLPSFTTREPRETDVVGKTYYFVSKQEFEEMIKKNEFYEYSQHHNNYYGTSRKLLNEKIKEGKIIVKDIDVNGTENLVKIFKNDIKILTIFLRVPKEELKKRLYNRDKNVTEEEINLRLSRFEYEESKANMYDYIIDNINLDDTVSKIIEIIEKEKNN